MKKPVRSSLPTLRDGVDREAEGDDDSFHLAPLPEDTIPLGQSLNIRHVYSVTSTIPDRRTFVNNEKVNNKY